VGTRSSLPWAVMAMEGALAFLVLAAWLGTASPAALALLPLGYLAADHSPWRGLRLERLGYGAAASLALRLLVAPRPADSSAAAVLGWLSAALLPAAAGTALWWRGTALAGAELTADGVRTEFVLAGGALLGLLALYPAIGASQPVVSAVAIVVFLCSGLVAVGMARQQAAGLPPSAGAGALVAGAALLLLVPSVALVSVLDAQAAAAILALVAAGLQAALGLLALLLAWLLGWLHPRLPAPGPLEAPTPNGLPPGLLGPGALPDWLQQLLLGAGLVLAGLAVGLLIVVVVWLLLALAQRGGLGAGARAPVAVEGDGDPRQDAAALLGAVRGWLAGRLGGALAARRPDSRVRDARAAYRAFLRWASGRGLGRGPAETPRELERRLAADLPEGAPHYAALTDAYVRARYGGASAGEAELARLRASLAALARLPPPAGHDGRRS